MAGTPQPEAVAAAPASAGPPAEPAIVLDHGTGAGLSRELVDLIVDVLAEVYLGELEDSALLPSEDGHLAVTTDSFVVDPPFFGNGDIGKVAVCGTVNDLAVSGAVPRYLTLAMILETGLPLASLIRVLESVRDTAREAGVRIVAGDTKVVRPGEADRIYLNTTGVGFVPGRPMRMTDVRPGDRVIVSGFLGDHTVHLLSIREGLGFESRVLSDCAPLNDLIATVRAAAGDGAVRSIRDVTRGGLSAVLHEYATRLDRTIRVRTPDLPIRHETRMATDMLGVNPIHCANEGCLCLFVAPAATYRVLDALRSHRYGRHAAVIGEVRGDGGAGVELVGADGRVTGLEDLRGAELPRLC
jgi:hydrogenase expression/formation protein HypE